MGWLTGAMAWQYVPIVQGSLGFFPMTVQLAYLALCLTPIILNRKEDRMWRHLQEE